VRVTEVPLFGAILQVDGVEVDAASCEYKPESKPEAPTPDEVATSRPVRDALGRFPKGTREGRKFTPGNAVAWKHGRRSRRLQAGQLPGQDALAATVREYAALVVEELGGPEAVSALKRGLIEDWAKLSLFALTVEQRIEAEGLLTAKGRKRATVDLWLSFLDRRHRVSQQIGLQRIARKLPSLEQLASDIAARTAATTPASTPDASAVHEGAHDEELDLR
jgi:hypothetical protein